MCGPSEHKRKGAELGINGFVSTCFVSDFYMDIKLGQAEVPFARREDNVHKSP